MIDVTVRGLLLPAAQQCLEHTLLHMSVDVITALSIFSYLRKRATGATELPRRKISCTRVTAICTCSSLFSLCFLAWHSDLPELFSL